jgi:hypothetical protein
MTFIQPSGPNQWVDVVGMLDDYPGTNQALISINPNESVWLETAEDWADSTLSTDFSVGAQIAQTVTPQFTTVGAKQVAIELGAQYFFKAVLAANDAGSTAQIRWYNNGSVIAGPVSAAMGQSLTAVQTSPAVLSLTSPAIIEAQVTLAVQADPSSSRAICYSSTIVKYGV